MSLLLQPYLLPVLHLLRALESLPTVPHQLRALRRLLTAHLPRSLGNQRSVPYLSAPRTGQTADRSTARLTGHDDEVARRRIDVDAAVVVAEGARTEEGPWHTVRRPYRRKKNNKITGTLLPGNGSLIGVERIFDLYLDGCATQTSGSDVLSHIRDQCIVKANFEALQCSSNYFKAFKITVNASEKEKLFSASIWPRGVIINIYFKPRLAQLHGRSYLIFFSVSIMICLITYKSNNGY